MDYEACLALFRKSNTITSLDRMEARALDKYGDDPFIAMNITTAALRRANEIQELGKKSKLSQFSEGMRQTETTSKTKLPQHLLKELEDIFVKYEGA